MKWLLALLVIGGLGYVGYTYKDEILAKTAQWRTGVQEAVTGPAPGTAPPGPAFESKIEAPPAQPGEKHLAPPGTYYMTQRVSKDTDSGVIAVGPAEPVALLERLPGNTMKVLHGHDTFVVKESQVTNDLDVARDVEKKDFVAHGGKL